MRDKVDLSKLKRYETTKKKKRINTRAKGNRYENTVCDKLNKRFGTKEFCRTPGSGAFATTHKLPEHLKVYGDLITPSMFRFIIECKKGYNEVNLGSLFTRKNKLKEFIDQAERDSKRAKKDFLIVWKQDRTTEIAIGKKSIIPKSRTNIDYKDYRITEFKKLLELEDSFWLLS